MLRAKKSLESFHKNNRILIFVFGGIYSVYGCFQIGIVQLQKKFLSSNDLDTGDHEMLDTMDFVFDNILLMMPYLIAIGIGYLIFGICYKTVKPYRLVICYIILAACIGWSFYYIITSVEQLSTIYDNLENQLEQVNDIPMISKFADASRFMSIVSLITSIAYMLGPILILTFRIKLNDAE